MTRANWLEIHLLANTSHLHSSGDIHHIVNLEAHPFLPFEYLYPFLVRIRSGKHSGDINKATMTHYKRTVWIHWYSIFQLLALDLLICNKWKFNSAENLLPGGIHIYAKYSEYVFGYHLSIPFLWVLAMSEISLRTYPPYGNDSRLATKFRGVIIAVMMKKCSQTCFI